MRISLLANNVDRDDGKSDADEAKRKRDSVADRHFESSVIASHNFERGVLRMLKFTKQETGYDDLR